MKEWRAWMPLYIGDYLGDTANLRALHSGAYLHLIMHYWQKGGLPSDDHQLAAIARMTDKEWRTARPTLSAFFQPGWRHKRIDEEMATAEENYRRRSEAGRAGAAARYGRGNVAQFGKRNAKRDTDGER